MSFVNFGMSFVLKGIQNPKVAKRVAKRELLDGVFQIRLDHNQFIFLVKSEPIHTASFSALYDARGNPENKFILQMLFNGTYPCELHAQSEAEREAVHRILQNIISRTQVSVDDALQDKSVHKQATVKKKGKRLATKRVIILNTRRHCLLLFFDGKVDQSIPSYHVLLHHKVSIHPRKDKSLQIVGTYKNLWLAFKTKDERDNWLAALNAALLPPPIVQQDMVQTHAPAFEPFVNFLPDPRKRKYIPASIPSIARAGPSPD